MRLDRRLVLAMLHDLEHDTDRGQTRVRELVQTYVDDGASRLEALRVAAGAGDAHS